MTNESSEWTDRCFELWAKAEDGTARYHALPFHLLDVVASSRALWDVLPPRVHNSVSNWLSLPEAEARSLCSFLAGTHDVGKANRHFQAKAQSQRDRLSNWHIDPESEPIKHGEVSNAFLYAWLTDNWNWPGSLAAPVASAIGGHHGTFLPDNRLNRIELNVEPWSSVSKELLDGLAIATCQADITLDDLKIGPWIAWLSGFVSVADWLGSHEGMVLFCNEPSNGSDYLSKAEHRAKLLVGSLGFESPGASECLDIESILPPGSKPNSMQSLAQSRVSLDFGLAIIEAPTGEGKTEAALCLAERSRASGTGMFFALPTMATANGLVGRVNSYLQRATKDERRTARLLHSMAWLYKTEAKVVGNYRDETESALEAEDWFTGNKRGLLAPYAVGTIDQALTGAILVKHFFVRLFALTGKVVVIDEVHAYDVYMSNLLSVLLSWLRALDCQVVVLSATLPHNRRNELLVAWGCEIIASSPYPCITWTKSDGSADTATFEVQARKPMQIQPLPLTEGDPFVNSISMLLYELTKGANTAAIITNTVREAQRLFRLAKNLAASLDIDCMMFHARFTAKDRQKIEKEVLSKFGKKSDRAKPTLLIATQVVEQSLDLDFDMMVSQLAPIDLLFQRAGRLHRHRRDGNGALQMGDSPDDRPNPILWVTGPSEVNAGDFSFANPVYCEATLAATWEEICDGLIINEPVHVSNAVDTVYAKVDAQLSVASESETPPKHLIRSLRKIRKHESAAAVATIVGPNNRLTVSLQRNPLEEDDDGPRNSIMAKTRLEELNSLTLVIACHGQELPTGKLTASDKRALILSTVKVSVGDHQLRELLSLPQGENWTSVRMLRHCRLAQLDEAMQFETPSYRYSYNSTEGLMWEKLDA